jgi:hypothetical protein
MKKTKLNSFLAALSLVIMPASFATVSASAAEGKQQLSSFDAKIYKGIVSTQLKRSTVPRAEGGWAIYSKLQGQYFSAEANSFQVSKELLALSEVNRTVELPGFDQVAKMANSTLRTYLSDARETKEPAGTLAYFPIMDHSTGRRGVPNPIATMVPAFNVPDDFDSSSQAFLWFNRSGQQSAYQDAFVSTVAKYRDVNRSTQHSNDNLWKSPGSGAFMTWAERDTSVPLGNRIFRGINDVDCVVDLNVLTALATYKQNHTLPSATAQGEEATCKLIVSAVKNGSVPKCGVYYDRSSEFWISFANAKVAGTTCLDPAVSQVEASMIKRGLVLANPKTQVTNATEVAEIIVALKKLIPADQRSANVQKLLVNLENRLRSLFQVTASGAAFPTTEDSQFIVRGFNLIRLDWYSPSYTSALALLALTLP